jgi:hypothetical protein
VGNRSIEYEEHEEFFELARPQAAEDQRLASD